MANRGPNANLTSMSNYMPQYSYKLMQFNTPTPVSKIQTINPMDKPYREFVEANRSNHLNINYNDVNAQATGFYGINTAYGSAPMNLYSKRSCPGRYPPM